MKEITLNNGKKIKLTGQSYEEYIKWRNELLRKTGQDLACNFPKFYGKIEFNIQGGKFVNANICQGVK